MKKTILFSIIIFTLLPVICPLTLEKDEDSKILAGITLDEYKKILKVSEPMDRLFCSGNICYFIVNKYRLDSLISRGFGINSVHKLPGKKKRTSSAYYDLNGNYHNYRETSELLTRLAEQYPGYAKLISLGESVEGRDIHILKISDNVDVNEDEPNVFIIGCHHAREWISVEIPLLYAEYLLSNMNQNPEVSKAVNGAQIYILPILNPDGLEFSIHKYRYWRKNRKYNGDFSWGVDLNRNYSYMWGFDDTGSSPSGLSEVFRGIAPFSEPETNVLQDFIANNVPSGVLSYHNFSQLILYPWGYTNDAPEDFDQLDKIGKKMSDLIFAVNGRLYTSGSGNSTIYNTNGGMVDWVYGTFRVPAYTIELPPEYSFDGGFFTSQEEIQRTFNENLPALLYFTIYFIDNKFPEEQIR